MRCFFFFLGRRVPANSSVAFCFRMLPTARLGVGADGWASLVKHMPVKPITTTIIPAQEAACAKIPRLSNRKLAVDAIMTTQPKPVSKKKARRQPVVRKALAKKL